ncbi:MAG TPA: hypothetical protein VEC16_05185 [Alphaproteobacteria bacterium]|nr:hypothetical protein [Alphaproteobacteria bacterium]
MADKLELIIDKIKQTIAIQDKSVRVGHAYYHEIDENFYNKVQVMYRDRIPEKYNKGLINGLCFDFTAIITKNYPDITIEKKKSGHGDRLIAEISLPKEKYNIKIN